jgi:hypothetical protein
MRTKLVKACCICGVVKDHDGNWREVSTEQKRVWRLNGVRVSHGLCRVCYENEIYILDQLAKEDGE